jgi:hypothetical protein
VKPPVLQGVIKSSVRLSHRLVLAIFVRTTSRVARLGDESQPIIGPLKWFLTPFLSSPFLSPTVLHALSIEHAK